MQVLEVAGQWYAILFDENGHRISTDGPYLEKHQAISMARAREIQLTSPETFDRILSSTNPKEKEQDYDNRP